MVWSSCRTPSSDAWSRGCHSIFNGCGHRHRLITPALEIVEALLVDLKPCRICDLSRELP
jgi:hypothetical protein